MTIQDMVSYLNPLLSNNVKVVAIGDRIKIVVPSSVQSIKFHNALNFTFEVEESEIKESTTGKYPVQFTRNIKSMYIYTNIIQSTRVCNTFTPLLKIVPYISNGGMITYTSKIAQYIKLCKNDISTIHIQIKDEQGDPFPFITNSKVMIALHFHKQQIQ